MTQGSNEWHQAKLGKFSASEIHKLMGIKGLGKTGETYILEKVTEELTQTWDELNAPALDWGKTLEPWAKSHYEDVFNIKVENVGFKEISNHAGVSPDGILRGQRGSVKGITFKGVCNKKGVEFKCPFNKINHTKNLLLASVEDFIKEHKEYYMQIQMCMFAYNFDNWDFVSYNPYFDGQNRMFVMNIERSESTINLMKERINEATLIKVKYLNKLTL